MFNGYEYAYEIVSSRLDLEFWYYIAAIITSIITFIIALIALIKSNKVSKIQIDLQNQDYKPLLAYDKVQSIFTISPISTNEGLHLILSFVNVGKCVLHYEITEMKLSFNQKGNDNERVKYNVIEELGKLDYTDSIYGISDTMTPNSRAEFYTNHCEIPQATKASWSENGMRKTVRAIVDIDIKIDIWSIGKENEKNSLIWQRALTYYEDSSFRDESRKMSIMTSTTS